MIAPRRFLPSMSSLLALEAVDRLGTASAAATDLSLTHSAVSRQLKVLEEVIGVALFRREGRNLILTAAGTEYARSIRDSLQAIARASLKVKAGGSRSSLDLAILPAFGMHWLSPRLREFSGLHPEIVVNLGTRLQPFDFNREKFDAAIHFGRQDWPGCDYLQLAGERVIPACAPELAAGLPNPQPADLLGMPLLHLESRPGAWEQWFEGHACPVQNLGGMLFDQFTPMATAAALGFGLALLPEFLAEAEFRAGRLVPAYPQYAASAGTYYLVWPSGRRMSRPLGLLVNWLRAGPSAPGGPGA